jgi:hypothetical protein
VARTSFCDACDLLACHQAVGLKEGHILPGLIGKSGARLVQGVICRVLHRLFPGVVVPHSCLPGHTVDAFPPASSRQIKSFKRLHPGWSPSPQALRLQFEHRLRLCDPELATHSSLEFTVGSSSKGKPARAVTVVTRSQPWPVLEVSPDLLTTLCA